MKQISPPESSLPNNIILGKKKNKKNLERTFKQITVQSIYVLGLCGKDLVVGNYRGGLCENNLETALC